MATKRNQTEKHMCRDCAHAYAPHETDVKGDFFLCKCPFREWSQFLNIEQHCETFKPNKNG